jgi:thiol-disulfide isomerase/thioredoxin
VSGSKAYCRCASRVIRFQERQAFEVDFDTQKDVLARYRVQSQSTMIILKDGKEVDRQVGQTDGSDRNVPAKAL